MNAIAIVLLITVSVPIYLIVNDARKALRRYGVFQHKGLLDEKDSQFTQAAENVFRQDPAVVAFIYGHTHKPSLTHIDGKCILNTGTWLKQVVHTSATVGRFPGIYTSSFRLNYFRITEEDDGNIRISYRVIPKRSNIDLTLTQRLLIFTRRKKREAEIPPETVIRTIESGTAAA